MEDMIGMVYLIGAGAWLLGMSVAYGARVARGMIAEALLIFGTILWPAALLVVAGNAIGSAIYRRRDRAEAARIERQRILDTPVERLGEGVRR